MRSISPSRSPWPSRRPRRRQKRALTLDDIYDPTDARRLQRRRRGGLTWM